MFPCNAWIFKEISTVVRGPFSESCCFLSQELITFFDGKALSLSRYSGEAGWKNTHSYVGNGIPCPWKQNM